MRDKRVTARRLAEYMDANDYGDSFDSYRQAHSELYCQLNNDMPRHTLYMQDALYLNTKDRRKKA